MSVFVICAVYWTVIHDGSDQEMCAFHDARTISVHRSRREAQEIMHLLESRAEAHTDFHIAEHTLN